MITDMLKFTVKEGCADQAKALMAAQMKANLGDNGCVISKTFQSKTNACDFYMLLCWENREAIDAHLETEHDLTFREGLDPILAGPPEFFEWDEV